MTVNGGADVRYDFGRNWSELAERLDSRHLDEAKRNLARLVGDVRDRTFLDIGCGSGLHSAAALALGAKTTRALDYDPVCVSTARTVLNRFATSNNWVVERADALDPTTLPKETYDIVYSWGVLHHTGDMWRAIRNAAKLVAPGGDFCLALYLQTPLCGVWKLEKKLYSSQKWLRPLIRVPYTAAFLTAKQIRTGDARGFVRNYKASRGMEFMVDVDDWLGGFPYESVSPRDLESQVQSLGFTLVQSFGIKSGTGLFGTGCGEWHFRKCS